MAKNQRKIRKRRKNSLYHKKFGESKVEKKYREI